MSVSIPVRPPRTPAEWAAYYQLRYAILRQPWQQPPGSEHLPDDNEVGVQHALICDAATGAALAVGRLHAATPGQGQVRMVAVAATAQGQGRGRQLMEYLEQQARLAGLTEIMLHARQNAVPFYLQLGYTLGEASYTLFESIPHFVMQKRLME